MLLERIVVEGLLVGSSLLPASEDDSDPLECERADGGVVRFAALSLPLVVEFSPGAETNGFGCEFNEALAKEFGALPSPAHVAVLAAALDGGCDSAVGCEFVVGQKPGAMGAKPAEQSRG